MRGDHGLPHRAEEIISQGVEVDLVTQAVGKDIKRALGISDEVERSGLAKFFMNS